LVSQAHQIVDLVEEFESNLCFKEISRPEILEAGFVGSSLNEGENYVILKAAAPLRRLIDTSSIGNEQEVRLDKGGKIR
jgi:hypothetical protein